MKLWGDKVRGREGGEFIVSFNASTKTRRSAIATAVICGFIFSLAGASASFMVLVYFLGNEVFERQSLLWFVVGASFLMAAMLAWAWGHRRCMFFVALTETDLQAGRGPQKIIPYEILEIIVIRSGNLMEFSGKKFTARVFLDPESQSECTSMLMQKCPNALFVDRLGNFNGSRMQSDPGMVLGQAASYSRKRAVSFVYYAVVGGAFVGFALYKELWNVELASPFDWGWLALGAFAIVLGTHRTVYYFRKASQLRSQIEGG